MTEFELKLWKIDRHLVVIELLCIILLGLLDSLSGDFKNPVK